MLFCFLAIKMAKNLVILIYFIKVIPSQNNHIKQLSEMNSGIKIAGENSVRRVLSKCDIPIYHKFLLCGEGALIN